MSIDYSSAKSYRMFFNYNNDKLVHILPVLPEEIQVTYKGEVTSVKIDGFGEVPHKGKRDAAIFKFESYLPPTWDKYVCSCPERDFKSPEQWKEWFIMLEEAAKPCHFVLTKSPLRINTYVDITNFTPVEKGGDPGTIYFSIEMKEHRDPTLIAFKKASPGLTERAVAVRTNNYAQGDTYRVAVSELYLRTGPNASIIATMPRGTIVTHDGRSIGNWMHVLYGQKWGYVYKSDIRQW